MVLLAKLEEAAFAVTSHTRGDELPFNNRCVHVRKPPWQMKLKRCKNRSWLDGQCNSASRSSLGVCVPALLALTARRTLNDTD